MRKAKAGGEMFEMVDGQPSDAALHGEIMAGADVEAAVAWSVRFWIEQGKSAEEARRLCGLPPKT